MLHVDSVIILDKSFMLKHESLGLSQSCLGGGGWYSALQGDDLNKKKSKFFTWILGKKFSSN